MRTAALVMRGARSAAEPFALHSDAVPVFGRGGERVQAAGLREHEELTADPSVSLRSWTTASTPVTKSTSPLGPRVRTSFVPSVVSSVSAPPFWPREAWVRTLARVGTGRRGRGTLHAADRVAQD